MLFMFSKDKDLLKTINIFQTICQSIEAWKKDVKNMTIENYWIKVRVLSAKYKPRNVDEENYLRQKD